MMTDRENQLMTEAVAAMTAAISSGMRNLRLWIRLTVRHWIGCAHEILVIRRLLRKIHLIDDATLQLLSTWARTRIMREICKAELARREQAAPDRFWP